MTLWGFIPGKRIGHTEHIESVGALPLVAHRLDTGELVTDLPGANIDRAAACGWWNLDTPDVSLLVATNDLTDAELAEISAERNAALAGRDARRQWVDDIKSAWEVAKGRLADRLGQPWSRPSEPPPSGTASLALHTQQITYLYGRIQELSEVIYGGGTIQTPGIADALITVTEVLLEVIEQSDGLELN